jgi:hypothetical protein
MSWEKECPQREPARFVGHYDIVVGGDIGIDRLVTDLPAPKISSNAASSFPEKKGG